MSDRNPPIIIAGSKPEKYLLAILLRGLSEDSIEIHYTDAHAGNVEYMLRLLRKSAGWIEVERGVTESMNLKCAYDSSELKICSDCGNKRIIKKCLHPNKDIRIEHGCSDDIRNICKGHEIRFKNLIRVKRVIIKKLPQMIE